MKKLSMLKIVSAAILASAQMTAHAQTQNAAPDWSLILNGLGVDVIQTMPAQVAPPRAAPVVVAPPAMPVTLPHTSPVQGQRPDDGWERRTRERDRQFQERFQERENYWLARERDFVAREKAFLEREKQRQLVVENNQRASAAINDRQEQQMDRIVEGVSNGRITKDEFISLMAQQKQINNQERQFLNDGFISQDEYNTLLGLLDQAGRSIRMEIFERGDRQQPRERIYYPQNR